MGRESEGERESRDVNAKTGGEVERGRERM